RPAGPDPSDFLRVLEDRAERVRYSGRATALSVEHHLNRRGVDAVRPIRPVDRVLEGPGRVSDLADADPDVVLLIEPEGRVITDAPLPNRGVDTLHPYVRLVAAS